MCYLYTNPLDSIINYTHLTKNVKNNFCFFLIEFLPPFCTYFLLVIQMTAIMEYGCAFACGALVYGAMEICFRGFTHWSMLITGGACFLIFHIINRRLCRAPLLLRCAMSCVIITALELLAGILVNRLFSMNVWDYSARRYNFMGQICALFSFFWFLMGIPMSYASWAIRDVFSAAG